jgi:membrane protein DedA with SNARE-associated domain
MEDLSNIHWLELVIGMLLGVPVAYLVGILAHMHAVRFGHFLDNRKLLKKAKTKQQALLVFNRIKAFKEGKRDRYPFYMILSSSAVCCSIIAATLILSLVIQQEASFETRMILSLFALVAVLMAMVFLASIYEHARQIERFDDYKKEFEARWGAE